MQRDATAYLQSWSSELTAKKDRVRNLIGDAHWLSDGFHKEEIIRDFLVRYLPSSITVGHGFVVTSELENGCSNEIDILVSDSTIHSPLFNEGQLQIVPPSSVLAYLEVKSEFNSGSLASALKLVTSTQTILAEGIDASEVWRGICFCSVPSSRRADSVLDTIEREIKKLFSISCDDVAATGASYSNKLPLCLATFEDFSVFISEGDSADQVKIRLFESKGLSLAVAVAGIFAVVRHRFNGAIAGELDTIIENLPFDPPKIRVVDIGAANV